ncbi:MAG: sensor histidine kinase KdpD [Kiritimatiellales bacterium]|jgi:two-component system sensor histidine kinase KdpD
MTDLQRPNPDALLAEIQRKAQAAQRGRLKIFLGMCAGVGKTYAMLKEAQARKADGCDVAIAYVQTHGRKETDVLLEGLEIISRRRIHHREVLLDEMDIDAVLERKPALALVDELAHTNVPGSRHPKRYQDVLELLDAGIDVYTTLNVQHIESRVDVVGQIVRAPVRETVPDTVLDRADDLQLVDITPQDLRERLADGKVYMGERAATAADHFFREENLTALREIALRVTADQVGQDVREAMTAKRVEGPWKSGERLMVAVGPSPYSEPLVRWTRRIAGAMDARWMAAYVETPRPLSEEQKKQLTRNLSLARELGAETVTGLNDDSATGLLRIAREHNVTQIIAGKPLPGFWLRFLGRRTLVDKLIQRSGDIDVCVVRAEKSGKRHASVPKLDFLAGNWKMESLIGLGTVAGITLLSWILEDIIGYWTIALLYLLAVVLLATRFSRRAIFLTATLGALTWNFLFIPPVFTFRISSFPDALMFIMYFVVAVVIGELTARLRLRESSERRREQRAQALYRIAQSAVESGSLDQGLRSVIHEVDTLLEAGSAVLLASPGGGLDAQPHPAGTWAISEKEKAVSAWSFLNGKTAGRFTDTLPESEGLHLPLKTAQGKWGVLAVRFAHPRTLAVDEQELIETLADHIAVIIERYRWMEAANNSRVAVESERLYKALFDCVSHELKTPLAVMTTAASELNLLLTASPLKGGITFLDEIETAVRRLRRVVDNLLDMTRLETGRLRLEAVWCDMDELMDAAQEQVADVIRDHRVKIVIKPELPSFKLDFGLMQHTLSNLLSNAAQYSPPETEIGVTAWRDEDHLVVRVSDRGSGFSTEMLSHAFDKFYRGSNARPGGTGLGLSIVRGFVQSMGGQVEVVNDPGGGAVFTLRVPVEFAAEVVS